MITLWKITDEVAVIEDDQMVGWDTRKIGYTTTENQEEELELTDIVANENDCEVRVTMEKILEASDHEVSEIIKALSIRKVEAI